MEWKIGGLRPARNQGTVKVNEMQTSADRTWEDPKDRDAIFRKVKKSQFIREAEIFKALGHPIRLKIVYGLLMVGGCNVKHMQECLGLHQATVSQHLIHLKSKGIITSTRQGLEMVYTVSDSWTKCIIENLVEKCDKAESDR